MSADREFVDDRERERIPADAPIRAIAPDDFLARSSESTFRAALRKLERETSRAARHYPRCPECGSVDLRRRSPDAPGSVDPEAEWWCAREGCWASFDEPDPSLEALAPGEQATLSEVRR